MKNFLNDLKIELFNYKLFLYLAFILLFSLIKFETIYAQDYSRPYDANKDVLWNETDVGKDKLYKASFTRNRIQNLVENCPDNWYIVAMPFKPFLADDYTFKFYLYNLEGQEIQTKVAQYPCPDECVPPMAFEKDRGFNFYTFDVADLRDIINDERMTFVTIHMSEFTENNIKFNTNTIYGLTGELNQTSELWNSGDPIFTSTKNVQAIPD